MKKKKRYEKHGKKRVCFCARLANLLFPFFSVIRATNLIIPPQSPRQTPDVSDGCYGDASTIARSRGGSRAEEKRDPFDSLISFCFFFISGEESRLNATTPSIAVRFALLNRCLRSENPCFFLSFSFARFTTNKQPAIGIVTPDSLRAVTFLPLRAEDVTLAERRVYLRY